MGSESEVPRLPSQAASALIFGSCGIAKEDARRLSCFDWHAKLHKSKARIEVVEENQVGFRSTGAVYPRTKDNSSRSTAANLVIVFRAADTFLFKRPMKIIRIPKRNGRVRVVYVPSPDEKIRLRSMVPRLNGFAVMLDRHGVAHGFMPNRSPVTNAMAHCGFPFSLSFDLADWFDHVTPDHVMNVPGLMNWLMERSCPCFVDGAARQGLPTSPAMANIAAAPMDNEIMALRVRGRLGWNFGCYTRFADDMTFSFSREATARWLKEIIPPLVERHKFKINPAKTRLQSARAGRRIITGVAVDDEVHAPRKIRRRIRAARHQRNWDQVRGLNEWAAMRLPWNYAPPPDPQTQGPITQTLTITYVAADTYVHATFIRRIV